MALRGSFGTTPTTPSIACNGASSHTREHLPNATLTPTRVPASSWTARSAPTFSRRLHRRLGTARASNLARNSCWKACWPPPAMKRNRRKRVSTRWRSPNALALVSASSKTLGAHLLRLRGLRRLVGKRLGEGDVLGSRSTLHHSNQQRRDEEHPERLDQRRDGNRQQEPPQPEELPAGEDGKDDGDRRDPH